MGVAAVAVVGLSAWAMLSRRESPEPTPPTTLAAAPAATPTPEARAELPVAPDTTPASPVVLQLAALEDGDTAARLQAVRELARMGPGAREAVPALVKRLGDTDSRVAEEAARALANTRDRSAAAPLASALSQALGATPSPRGLAAAQALARLGNRRSQEAIEALLRAARDATDPALRIEAATALAALAPDPPGTIASSLAEIAAKDADESVRRATADAADALDPRARPRLAAAALVERGQAAERAGRLASPPDDCALGHALAALAIDSQSLDAQRLRERAAEAIGAEVRTAAKTDAAKAERLLEQALLLEPGRVDAEELRTTIATAKKEEYRRARVFRLVHKHGSRSALGGLVAIGDGQTKACRGLLELLEDGFRFKTEESEDSRTDDVVFGSAQIKSVQIRENGRQLRIETAQGRFDFYGDGGDLRRILRALTP